MMVNAPYRVNFGLWQVFMYKEALSFVDGDNAHSLGCYFSLLNLSR